MHYNGQGLEHEAEVVNNQQLSPRYCRLTLRCSSVAEAAKPGQFVNLLSGQYLRRPLAVATVDDDLFTVGIEIKGEGTRELSRLAPGENVNILGPLGHGYTLEGAEQLLVVGGGTGIFPLQHVLQKARAAGVPTLACFGFRSRQESFLLDELEEQSDELVVTSDLGDLGISGTVLRGLEALWDSGRIRTGCRILCCGPKPMMRSVAAYAARRELACEVSLEEHMACGVGLCLTCVCKTRDPETEAGYHYSRSCLEGPVFAAADVIWD